MSSAVSPYVWTLYFWPSCSAVDTDSSTSMFVYKETTSNEMGISPWSDDRGHYWNFAISSAVLLMCALTCFSSGFKISWRSQLSLSKIPFLPETIGRILRVSLCVFGRV